MADHRIVGALGIASVLALGAATPASASPLLGIELIESGSPMVTSTGTDDPLIYSHSFGSFSINTEVNTLVTDPLSMDLGSTNISSTAPGTLTVVASASGLDTPQFSGFISQFTGGFTGAATSITLQTYLASSLFGKDTLLSSFSSTGSAFSAIAGNNAAATGPFALTEVLTITTSGKSNISFDGQVASAPEIDAGSGGAAIALLLGALGLVGERRRRTAASA